MLMVRRGVMFSLRLASCWRVEVMNGGAGVRFFLPRLISPTANGFPVTAFTTHIACSSFFSSALPLPSP